MTDERMDDTSLMCALNRLPRGAGVVFRHYSLAAKQRRALFDQVRATARRRKLVLLLAGSASTARAWKADGWHGRTWGPSNMLHSAPVHSVPELRKAAQVDACLLFVSPVFATRSHPGARVLGRIGFARLAQRASSPTVALGGMTHARWRGLRNAGAYGWAAISAWAS
ncbi:thiamine phosphate synthase [Sphingobium sp. SCG-1]|uniref:thiamine phosphate synthase n=1 Tax=Sphingobium sp. SCG-1 TaxID=2072936 RepID=UPI001CB90B74|nr:thiamine phosphate synthase [Sphingobium sp. SCG-1]